MSIFNSHFPEETPTPASNRMLRQFAALCFGIFGLLCVLSWRKHGGMLIASAWLAAAIAVLVGVPGMIWPSYIRPIFMGITAVTEPIGHVTSIIVLGIIYYAFLTPLALVFRWTGRDVLRRRRSDPQADSYWTPRTQPDNPRLYLRQYQKQQASDVERRRSEN